MFRALINPFRYQNKRARIKREMKKKRTSAPPILTQLPAVPETFPPQPELSQPVLPQPADDVTNSIRPFLQRKAKQHAKVRR